MRSLPTFLLAALAALLIPTLGCGSSGSSDNGGDPPEDPGAPEPCSQPADASFQPDTVNQFPVGDTDCAQTFTVQTTGTLTCVELQLSGNSSMDTLRVDIRATQATGTNPPQEDDVMVLGSAFVDASTLGATRGIVPVDLSATDIPVTQGDLLAIVIRRTTGADPVAAFIWGDTTGGYAEGNGFRRPSGGMWSQGSVDFWFVTHVQPPAPASGP